MPHGAVHYYGLGNGILHAVSFNPRLQQTESYEAVYNDPAKMLFVSCPKWGNSANPGVYDLCPHPAATADNGNLVSYDESYGGPGAAPLAFHQTFTYDSVNRLSGASDSGGWSRTFNYDPFGNMWVPTSTGPATGAYTTNVYGPNNRVGNVPYDAAGNLLVANGNLLSYDAESRQAAATEPQMYGGGQEQYLYDGSGQRVVKVNPSGTITYVYDALGQMTGEYSTAAAAASPCTTCYLSTDHLGSTRLVTDQNANVMARHDFFPFGEEIAAAQAGRDGHFGSGNDTVNQKFIGQQRDQESGLDYFGARYYGSALGRFTSPDEPLIDQHTQDPQSWNLYSYVRNNPLSHVDLTGEDCITTSSQTSSGVEVTTERGGSAGTCSGTYVDGTANTNSYQYNGSNVTYSFANDTNSGAGNIQFGQSGSDDSLSPGVASMLNRAGNMAAPGVNLAGAGLMTFGSLVAPIPMALAQCGAGNCDGSNLAMAVIPDLGPILKGANLARAARGVSSGRNLRQDWRLCTSYEGL